MGASVGIALYPEHGDAGDALLRRADVAMYVAKRAGAGIATYQPDQDVHTVQRLARVGELRRAIEAGDLVLHYQPKLSLGPARCAPTMPRLDGCRFHDPGGSEPVRR